MGGWIHKGKPVQYCEIQRCPSGEVYGANPSCARKTESLPEFIIITGELLNSVKQYFIFMVSKLSLCTVNFEMWVWVWLIVQLHP